jgi:probable selenium-dependent hydroxylase accessory protein YqeC
LFREQFQFQLPAVINFVGGGGKTGLILTLLREYAASIPVVYTTTTRIHPPDPSLGLLALACDDMDMLALIVDRIGRMQRPDYCSLVVTRRGLRPDLLRGVSPTFASRLDGDLYPLILNEADGARSMSLKMPREGEPVLMEGARYLVPVIGLDCLGQPLGPGSLFRWEMAEARFSLKAGEIITPDLAARLLLHPQGVCKDNPPGVRIIPFINKADTSASDDQARELAHALLTRGSFQVERVVWGSLHSSKAASTSAFTQ